MQNIESDNLIVTFWGTRGSRPIPGPDSLIYGGNTPCVSVEAGGILSIFDAGTGICNLGNSHPIFQRNNVMAYIFITHTHWDHIQGFPFFTPAFIKGNKFVLCGQSKLDLSFAELMEGQMMYPHFPVQLNKMGANMDFVEIDNGSVVELGNGVTVSAVFNNHPGGGLSYRLDYNGKSCCYVTDTEHYSCVDPHMKSFVSGTDLLIYDSHFTNEEYEGTNGFNTKVGWGHSTWQEAIKLAKVSGVRKLALFHHATHRTDKELAEIEKLAQKEFDTSFAAAEGMKVTL